MLRGVYGCIVPTLSLGHDLLFGVCVRLTNFTVCPHSGLRTSGWVHDKVSACASDLLLEGSLHTRMLFRQREIVANLREDRGRSIPDNFLRRLREVVNVPHHCLATVSVAVQTGQLRIVSSFRIEGLPLPGYHLKLTRHLPK